MHVIESRRLQERRREIGAAPSLYVVDGSARDYARLRACLLPAMLGALITNRLRPGTDEQAADLAAHEGRIGFLGPAFVHPFVAALGVNYRDNVVTCARSLEMEAKEATANKKRCAARALTRRAASVYDLLDKNPISFWVNAAGLIAWPVPTPSNTLPPLLRTEAGGGFDGLPPEILEQGEDYGATHRADTVFVVDDPGEAAPHIMGNHRTPRLGCVNHDGTFRY